MSTPQELMQETLSKSGIPYKEIRCYGSQIMVTAWSEGAARKWAALLAKFATRVRMKEILEVNKVQKGTRLVERHKEWLIGGTI